MKVFYRRSCSRHAPCRLTSLLSEAPLKGVLKRKRWRDTERLTSLLSEAPLKGCDWVAPSRAACTVSPRF